jgi:gliding motility-associated-like protein
MLIYDRWGSRIFESTVPAMGWDGKRNGSDLPQGVYAYIIRLERFGGSQVEYKGAVLLLR